MLHKTERGRVGCTECRKHQRLDCLTAPHQWPTRGRPVPRGSSSFLTDTGAQGSAGLHGENRTMSLTRLFRKSVTGKIGGLGTQCPSLRVSTRSKSRESFKDIVRGEMDEFLHESLKEELQSSKTLIDLGISHTLNVPSFNVLNIIGSIWGRDPIKVRWLPVYTDGGLCLTRQR